MSASGGSSAGEKLEILGVKIDKITITETLHKIEVFLSSGNTHYIVTVNPEMVVLAQKDAKFKNIINQADLAVPDGIGLVFASRWLYPKNPLKEKITGIDLMLKIISKQQNNAIKIFLLGAKNGIAKLTALKLKKIYPKINIVGVFGGEADEKGDRVALALINKAKPDILFVAYGAPKQEKWIARNLKNLPSVKLAIGVGGAFDMISGKIKRAPLWMRKIGLEWLWRFAMEPRRISRIYNATVKFTWLVLIKQKK